jgi:hypothetical protein
VTNDFKQFANTGGANVISQASWAALTTLLNDGYQDGAILPAQYLNKQLRQSATMNSVLAQFIAQQTAANIIDDGTTATILANLTASICSFSSGSSGSNSWGMLTFPNGIIIKYDVVHQFTSAGDFTRGWQSGAFPTGCFFASTSPLFSGYMGMGGNVGIVSYSSASYAVCRDSGAPLNGVTTQTIGIGH